MAELLILEAAICTAAFILGCAFFQEEPKQPPSHSALYRRRSRNLFLLRSQAGQDGDEPLLQASPSAVSNEFVVSDQIWKCLSDYNFVILLVSVGIGLGIFNAMTTLIEQIVRNHGYSQGDASLFGSAMLIVGLMGAGKTRPQTNFQRVSLFPRSLWRSSGQIPYLQYCIEGKLYVRSSVSPIDPAIPNPGQLWDDHGPLRPLRTINAPSSVDRCKLCSGVYISSTRGSKHRTLYVGR